MNQQQLSQKLAAEERRKVMERCIQRQLDAVPMQTESQAFFEVLNGKVADGQSRAEVMAEVDPTVFARLALDELKERGTTEILDFALVAPELVSGRERIVVLSQELLNAGKSAAGGFNKTQLAVIGVAWPVWRAQWRGQPFVTGTGE